MGSPWHLQVMALKVSENSPQVTKIIYLVVGAEYELFHTILVRQCSQESLRSVVNIRG